MYACVNCAPRVHQPNACLHIPPPQHMSVRAPTACSHHHHDSCSASQAKNYVALCPHDVSICLYIYMVVASHFNMMGNACSDDAAHDVSTYGVVYQIGLVVWFSYSVVIPLHTYPNVTNLYADTCRYMPSRTDTCMCIYIYIYDPISVHACVYTYLYAYSHLRVCVHTHMSTLAHMPCRHTCCKCTLACLTLMMVLLKQ